MNLSFEELTHTYKADGRVQNGVTSILEATRFYKKPPEWRNDPKYRDLGKAVHAGVYILEGGLMDRLTEPLHEDTRSRVMPYLEFKRLTGFVVKVYEVALCDPTRNFAGTLDLMGVEADGLPTLVDIKTGTVPIRGVSMQLAGYLDLARTGHIIPVSRTLGPALDWEWFEKVRRDMSTRIRRKSLNLTPGKYTLRSHDETRWSGDWAAALRTYNNWQEEGVAA